MLFVAKHNLDDLYKRQTALSEVPKLLRDRVVFLSVAFGRIVIAVKTRHKRTA